MTRSSRASAKHARPRTPPPWPTCRPARSPTPPQRRAHPRAAGPRSGRRPRSRSTPKNAAISLKKSGTVVGSSDGRYSAPGQTVDYSYRSRTRATSPSTRSPFWTPNPGSRTWSCPDTALFPGISETCTATYTTTQADVDAGSISNTATATGKAPCGQMVWATSSAKVYAEQKAAISLEKSATVVGSSDGRYSAPGQTVDYSYLITNTGNVALNPVTLLDPKPGLEDLAARTHPSRRGRARRARPPTRRLRPTWMPVPSRTPPPPPARPRAGPR